MISVQNLHFSYGKIQALHGVNLEVPPGKITAIVGANGAGKSTLMKCLAGLLKPASGTIYYDGAPLPSEPHKVVRRKLVLVPEGRWIFPNLTVEENLRMGAYTVKDSTKGFQNAYELFPRLDERKKQLAGTLSGGEQQMLAIARALMSEPRMILMDEPSLGLAPLVVNEVMQMIKRINQLGITVLVVEQNAKKMLAVADYACVVEQGRIVKTGTGAQLSADEEIIQSYLGGKRRRNSNDR